MGEVELSSALAPLSRYLAMPHPKSVGWRAHYRSETHCSHAERTPPRRTLKREILSPAHLSASMSKAALRTITSMLWSMGMACMGAWLGGRGLTYGGRRTHPTQSEHHRAPPATLYRAELRVLAAALSAGSAPQRRKLQLFNGRCDRDRSFESGVGPAALLRPRFDKRRAIHWMPRCCGLRVPSTRVCSFSRKHKRFRL